MRIGVFCYDFPHHKSSQGLLGLAMAQFDPVVVFAQKWRKLNVRRSKLPIRPARAQLHEPAGVAYRLGFRVVKVDDHNSTEVVDLCHEMDLELGVILGARILSRQVIESFKVGILNVHPGLLPWNRGLDNIKWAIVHGIRQGVTAHLIDEKIDAGRMVCRRVIDVHRPDTLTDISVRIEDLEQIVIVDAVAMLQAGRSAAPFYDLGVYHGAVPDDLDETIPARFETYRKNYAAMFPGVDAAIHQVQGGSHV